MFICSYPRSWNQSLADKHWRVGRVFSAVHIAVKVAVGVQKAADSCRGSPQTALALRADICEPCRHRLELRIESSCFCEKRFLRSTAAWRGSRLQKAAPHNRDLYLQHLQGGLCSANLQFLQNWDQYSRFDFLLQLSQYFQHNFPATSAILPSLVIFSQPSVCLKFEPKALLRLERCAKQEYVHTTHTGAFHPWQHLCLKYHVVCQFLYCEIWIKNSTTIDAKAQTVAASSSCLLGFYQNLLHFMKFGPLQRTLRHTQTQTHL